ncbi:MAG TPA: hypothetical protein VGB15_22555 [Longimicrobium sp.]|jgi:hypothetical protein
MSSNDDRPASTTRLDRLKSAAYNHPVMVALLIVLATIAAMGEFADRWNSLLVGVGVRPDVLDVAADDAKGAFSRRLTELAWRRLYWSNTFTGRVKRNAPPGDSDEAWRQYSETVADWSAELVNMQGFLDEHYGVERSKIFQRVHSQFQAIHLETVKLRYESAAVDSAGRANMAEAIQQQNNSVNLQLCRLVGGLDEDAPGAKIVC